MMKKEIRKHIERSCLEIIVIVEGIEPNSSHSFQARNSYTIDNIVFDHWVIVHILVCRGFLAFLMYSSCLALRPMRQGPHW